jgi:hypothetical protein
MRSWSRRFRLFLGGALIGAGVLLTLAGCALSPPVDEPGDVSSVQGARAILRPDPPARVLMRYHEFFDVTVVEYRVATSAWLTFLAYYTAHGRTPSGPPETLNLGCIVHPDPDHRGHGEGSRLLLRVDGQEMDMGELRFTPEPHADSYWLERVSHQAMLPLFGAGAIEGSCGGLPFRLSPAQLATFEAFVAGTAAESER